MRKKFTKRFGRKPKALYAKVMHDLMHEAYISGYMDGYDDSNKMWQKKGGKK